MALTGMGEILDAALRGSYCVGYFEAWDEYSLEAVWGAAERTRSPVFLGFGAAVTDQFWLDRWGIDALTRRARFLAERAPVPAAVLLNEARTTEQARRALEAGANAVMVDTSRLPVAENIEVVGRLVRIAGGFGAEVEAELGQLAGLSGTETLTDPREAARFVAETGVHALAVSVGSVHALAEGEAGIDLDLLGRIRAAVPVPLVLHGGSGLSRSVLPKIAERGVAKINYGTRLKMTFMGALREAIAGMTDEVTIHRYVGSRTRDDVLVRGACAMEDMVAGLMEAYGSAGKATVAVEGGKAC
jgi:fructose-bisphosphate aldolase class II